MGCTQSIKVENGKWKFYDDDEIINYFNSLNNLESVITKKTFFEIISNRKILYKWLNTKNTKYGNGRQKNYFFDWLETFDGIEWLNTDEGFEWLGTKNSCNFIDSKFSLNYLKTKYFWDWISIKKNWFWLETLNGISWLDTNNGWNWINSEYGKKWLFTKEGKTWIEKLSWLEKEHGKEWLCDDWSWLKLKKGLEWLSKGKCYSWINTIDGHRWLDSKEGDEWLITENGEKWLFTKGGFEWFNSKNGDELIQYKNGNNWLINMKWLKCKMYWPLLENEKILKLLNLNNGLKWLSTIESFEWINTINGNKWINTLDGYKWFDTSNGCYWLSTCEGLEWLISENGKKWFETKLQTKFLYCICSYNWIKSKDGEQWLKTPDGYNWLLSNIGLDWLYSKHSKKWIITDSAYNFISNNYEKISSWFLSENGLFWLSDKNGKYFLEKSSGHNFLNTEKGKTWLNTEYGRKWLNSNTIRNWFCCGTFISWVENPINYWWLKTSTCQKWFEYEGFNWINSKKGIEFINSNNSNGLLESYLFLDILSTNCDFSLNWLTSINGKKWINNKINYNRFISREFGKKWINKNGYKFCYKCEILIIESSGKCECLDFSVLYSSLEFKIKEFIEKKVVNNSSLTYNLKKFNRYFDFKINSNKQQLIEKFIEGCKQFSKNKISSFLNNPNNFVIAMHGTPDLNDGINIYHHGWEVSKRKRNAYGNGDYFSINLNTVHNYAEKKGVIILSVLINPNLDNTNQILKVVNPSPNDLHYQSNDIWYVISNTHDKLYSFPFGIINCNELISINKNINSFSSNDYYSDSEHSDDDYIDDYIYFYNNNFIDIINGKCLIYFEGDNKYELYDSNIMNKIIYNLKNNILKTHFIANNSKTYLIDLNKMEQINLETNYKRKIRIIK